jgi:SAM-dependent methyltransferase
MRLTLASGPALAGLIEAVLAPGARADVAAGVRDRLPPIERQWRLDVGCGFRSYLPTEGGIGVDLDEARVRASRGVAANACALPFADGCFAGVLSVGLLHHLPDAAARQAIAEMLRVSAGRVVVFDGVRPQSALARPLAALVRAMDRGRHMRLEAEVKALFGACAPWRFERVTYARTGLEGLWCVHETAGGE